jgi:hypothetical protein
MKLDEGPRRIEFGLTDFVARYEPEQRDAALMQIVMAIAYLDDVEEDDLVPASKDEIASYWAHRQPELVHALGRT